MNAAIALGLLRGLATPVVTTSDASALLGLSTVATSKTLKRLASAKLLFRLRKGIWTLTESVEPLSLVEHLTVPYPSYISLLTALYLHGMITQIPAMIYVVSLSRTQRIRTTAGTFTIHRIAPSFFGGFELLGSGVKLAVPEKALLDVLYLSATRNHLFASLPEIELPSRFSRTRAREWICKIPSGRLRTIVSDRFQALLRSVVDARTAKRP